MREALTEAVCGGLWEKAFDTRVLFATLLVMVDENGIVEEEDDKIQRMARLSPEQYHQAKETLLKRWERTDKEGNGAWMYRLGNNKLKLIGFKKPESQPKPEDPKRNAHKEMACRFIDFINKLSDRDFRKVDATLNPIIQRIKEVDGDEQGMMKMILKKKAEWEKNPEMWQYFTPTTLFRAKNFASYYGSRNEAPAIKRDPPWLRRKILQEKISKSPANFDSVYYDRNASNEERKKLIAMRKELAELPMQ